MRGIKAALAGFVLLGVLALLPGCALLRIQGEATLAKPNLGLLEMEPYQDGQSQDPHVTDGGEDYLRLDLWLDATQGMGGVNPYEESMYPHFGWRYREGGFHYRLGHHTGWYENVLRGMLGAAQGSRTRVLRYGNERLPESYLKASGLAPWNASQERLRSLRRDLMTYAVDPLPSVFGEMSAEDMALSFYALGSPMLNQMARFAQDGGAELENPGQVEAMSQVLEGQIASIGAGRGAVEGFLAKESKEENDYPLLYALENIDLSRLSVILCDPASLRSLSGTTTAGEPVAYLRQLLQQRGLFDQGLTVGLYAFQLDYVGQIASVGAADLREPLIWGKPIFDNKKNTIQYMAPMPRLALALVVGERARVESYMAELNARLNADQDLYGLRGPQEGELTYARQGATVTQQPFGFAYWHTLISRPQPGYYTQHSPGAALEITGGEGQVAEENGFHTVFLAPDQEGVQQDRRLAVSFPLAGDAQGAAMDLSRLQDARVEVLSALLLDRTVPSGGEAQAGEEEQVLPLRDKLYVFSRQEQPFANQPEASPFALEGLTLNQDSLVCSLAVEGAKLAEGYYRLQINAYLTAQEVVWLPVDWIDGPGSLAATITREDIVAWETFAQAVHQYDAKKQAIPRAFTHAWGPYTSKLYHGLAVPDVPPVDKAPGLRELAAQLRQAATPPRTSLVCYVFDVFVDNQGTAQSLSSR